MRTRWFTVAPVVDLEQLRKTGSKAVHGFVILRGTNERTRVFVAFVSEFRGGHRDSVDFQSTSNFEADSLRLDAALMATSRSDVQIRRLRTNNTIWSIYFSVFLAFKTFTSNSACSWKDFRRILARERLRKEETRRGGTRISIDRFRLLQFLFFFFIFFFPRHYRLVRGSGGFFFSDVSKHDRLIGGLIQNQTGRCGRRRLQFHESAISNP